MKNRFFTLSRRNQKGQVAIFVALIFQVIFVFFAILINVGLLVHHKINLQQSTDLAAYYGAMKQAEIMNAISHVNFQMRQAWKLLTWRYRIVGTFAFQATGSAAPNHEPMTFPLSINFNSTPTTFNGTAAETFKCPRTNVNSLDVPFFCGGHSFFADWPVGNENNCRIDCGSIDGFANSINSVPLTGAYDNPYTNGVAGAVNSALIQANSTIRDRCDFLGPAGFQSLYKFIMSYGAEVQKKKKLIQMLGADLSADVSKSRDLDGGLIQTGAKNTFENNLTEANLAGKISFSTVNGLSQGECPFEGTTTDGEDSNSKKQFLKEIRFQNVQFFIQECITRVLSGVSNYRFDPGPVAMFSGGSLNDIPDSLFSGAMIPDKALIKAGLLGTQFIIGYEKNPWCQVYYGAKAQSEPRIPFLPIGKIKLSAVSVAKPFGGSIGPRYNSIWSSNNATSSGGAKVDPTLPARKFSGVPPGAPLVQFQFLLPNYSNFVGDEKGLKNSLVAGAYQDLLLYRSPQAEVSGLHISVNQDKSDQAVDNIGIHQPREWPSALAWKNIINSTGAPADYLAKAKDGISNSYLRDLEISVIAPNQFDLNYYSIDPDFYNNYYLKIVGGAAGPITYVSSFNALRSAAGVGPDSISDVTPDYGYSTTIPSNSVASNYSVRHQIAVASGILKSAVQKSQGAGQDNRDIFRFLPDKTSSLLTGWTFQDFSHYVDDTGNNFPSAGPDSQNTMTFGKCNDLNWNNTNDTGIENSFDTPVSKNLPPTPGNCVWGGRTGYSVKIVSPSLVRSSAPPQDYGGGGGAAGILNPIDESFFSF